MAQANPRRNLNVKLGSNAQEAGYELANAVADLCTAFTTAVANMQDAGLPQADRNTLTTALETAKDVATQAKDVYDSTRKKTGTAQKTPLVTPIPDYDAADPAAPNLKLRRVTDLPNQRDLKISTLSGDRQEAIECRTILRRIIDEADNRRLDEATTIKFLKQYSAKAVYATICALQDDDGSLETILRQLETQYCGLAQPDAAKKELQSIRRLRGETLIQFGQRIDELAFMACRLDNDARQHQQLLAQKIFVDSLESSLRLDVNAIIRQREIGGFQELSQFELFSQAHKLEIERGLAVSNSAAVPPNVLYMHDSPTSDLPPDEATCNRIQYGAGPRRWNQKPPQFQQQNFPYRPPFRRPPQFNRRTANVFAISDSFDCPLVTPDEEQVLADAGVVFDPQSNELLVPTDTADQVLRISAQSLNVRPDQCLRCGQSGHRALSPSCPLRNHPITPRPCSACQVGGHLAVHCVNRPSKNV